MRTVTTTILYAMLSFPAALSPAVAQTSGGSTSTAAPTDAATKRAMQRVESHIAELHKRLAITPAQEPQWTAFASVMRQNAQAMEQNYNERQAHATSMSALDDMRSYASISHMHAENVDRLLPVFESLYNSMNAEQRVAADKTFQEFQRTPGKPGRA